MRSETPELPPPYTHSENFSYSSSLYANPFIEQIEHYPQEKLHVSTDKDSYIAGDTIWLRAHCADAATHRPVAASRYVYVELRDDRGALALGRYTPEIREEGNYEMLLVVNRARPLTRTAEDTVQVLREIEAACGLPFTGIVNNTNLGPQTAAEDVLSSVPYAEAVSRLTGLPVFMTCCAEALYPELAGTIDRLFPLKLQKLYYQLTQEVSYGKTNISGRAL